MLKTEMLQSLVIDVERGVYQLNGVNIGDNTSELHLDFENGEWSLQVTQDQTYGTRSGTACRCL